MQMRRSLPPVKIGYGSQNSRTTFTHHPFTFSCRDMKHLLLVNKWSDRLAISDSKNGMMIGAWDCWLVTPHFCRPPQGQRVTCGKSN